MLLLATSCLQLHAQNAEKKIDLHVSLAQSTHGSGDMKGVSFSTGLSGSLSKYFGWQADLTGTIHDHEFVTSFQPGTTIPASTFRYGTSGVQTSYLLTHNFTPKSKNSFSVKLGGLVRYQTSSFYNSLSIHSPAPGSGSDLAQLEIQNSSPARTISVGYMMQLSYAYAFNPKSKLELFAAFQNDTHGDAITHLGLGYFRQIKF